MSRPRRGGAPESRSAKARPIGAAPFPPLPVSHPAFLGVLAIAALAVAGSVAFRMFDPDAWQHLAVGRALWALHHVPTTQVWVWPTYGAPSVTPSWAFRALLWPFYAAGGDWGLFGWRALTGLATFALAVLAARRLGARGVTPFVIAVLAALTWRHRSQVRPETLASVLLALELWLLESARSGAPRRAFAVAPLLGLWANVHVSWTIGFVVLAAYLGDAARAAWGAQRGATARDGVRVSLRALLLVFLAGAAACFVNPSGARGLAEPFQYALFWRGQPLYRTIAELAPFDVRAEWRTGLPLLLAGWPLLAVWRAVARRRLDWAEAVLVVAFGAFTLTAQRFAGFFAIAAVPFVSRDVGETWFATARPRALSRPTARAVAAVACILALGAAEWTRPDLRPGIGFDLSATPVAAADFMAAEGLGGRLFNEYYNGGYLLWRFWPDRRRLPFMDIHQSGREDDRALYPYVFADPDAWRRLDERRHFDLALVDANVAAIPGDRLLDVMDADSSYALVFSDDVACLYARRDGACRDAARRLAFQWVPGGDARMEELGPQAARDTALRAGLERELARQIASSRRHARASVLLAGLRLLDGRPDEATRTLEEAAAARPDAPVVHQRLGELALGRGDAARALEEFATERAISGPSAALEKDEAEARRRLAR
ncbi:MAG TPA: hypothetical protein VL332_04490 [Candidatus Saccharimonadaceae bacterium]|nr:hypothetical protein [Candidatus Saccharimonadaceae bacterium]